MGKYKKNDLIISTLEKYYKLRSINESITIDELKHKIKNVIITELYNTGEIQDKVKGMCYRNYINNETRISEDVIQESFMELSRHNIDDLFLAYCSDPKRILALGVSITKRTGFRKMNTEVSPNQSVAKKILFASNLNRLNYISTTNDDMVYGNPSGNGTTVDFERTSSGRTSDHTRIMLELKLFETPIDDSIDVWEIIKMELNDEEREFLYFLLHNIFNKKSPTYSKKLRDTYMSFNEYRINLIMLKSRIKDIIHKNKIKI